MIDHNTELATLEHIDAIQERDLAFQNAEKQREHELSMARLKVKTVENRKIRERVLMALIKLPLLLLIGLWLPLLLSFGVPIPAFVENLFNL